MIDENNIDTTNANSDVSPEAEEPGVENLFGNPFDALNPDIPEDDVSVVDDKPNNNSSSPELTARFNKSEERALSAEMENKVMRGQMLELRESVKALQENRNTNIAPPVAPEKKPLFKIPTREEIQTKLEKSDSAADTIIQMFTDAATGIEQRLDERLNGVNTHLQNRDAHQRLATSFNNDRDRVINKFTKEVATHPDFIEECDAYTNEIAQSRGIKNALPGDLFAAATYVFNEWRDNGKLYEKFGRDSVDNIINKGRKPNNNSNERPSLKQLVRNVNGNDERKLNGNNSNRSNGKKGFKDLYPDATEERVARHTAKQMGLTEDEWVRSYERAEKENAFGN
jgi:hypothetical protein